MHLVYTLTNRKINKKKKKSEMDKCSLKFSPVVTGRTKKHDAFQLLQRKQRLATSYKHNCRIYIYDVS